MIELSAWAKRHNITSEALAELRSIFLNDTASDPALCQGDSEAAVQTRIRLEASAHGARLWRNNVGACYTAEGDFIRYGIANDSTQLNKKIKSSDLIGIKPILITKDHVGACIGQFVARECKRSGWKYSGTKREIAQLKFLELVVAMGGDAAFANSEGSL